MNMPVDVIATFNTCGKIKPNYVRLEDNDHMLHTYKIVDIEYDKEEKYAGTSTLLYCCNIQVNNCLQQIKIKYHIATHQWVLVQ